MQLRLPQIAYVRSASSGKLHHYFTHVYSISQTVRALWLALSVYIARFHFFSDVMCVEETPFVPLRPSR